MSAWSSPTSCLCLGQFGRSLLPCQPGHRLHHVYVVVSLARVSRSVSLVIAYVMFMLWSVWPESLAVSAWLSPTSCLCCGQFGRSLSQCQPGHRLRHVYVVVSLAGVSRSVSLVIAYIMFMFWSVWPESLAVSAWLSPTSCLCCGQFGRSLSQCQPGHRLHHVYVVVSLAGVSRSVSLVIAYMMFMSWSVWPESLAVSAWLSPT